MGARLLREEWNQTWWSLKSALLLMKENTQSKSHFLYTDRFSMPCYLLDVYTFLWKGNSQNKDEFFQNTMNFESGFHNYRNIFFTIASNI